MKNKMMVGVLAVAATALLANNLELPFGGVLRSCNKTVEAAQEAEEPNVYASVSVDMPEEYQVTIPKSVTLDGSTKSGTYTVMVSGDLSGEEILSVTPEKTVSMSRDDGATVSGTITQSKTKWTSEAVGENGKGTISVSDLSAGEWEGSFDFTVSVLDKETFEETITYTDFTLTADNYYMAGITRSGDVVIPETFEYDGSFYRITEIGDSCFYNCSSITSVVIPDSVLKIGNYAFYNNNAMTSITIGSSVSSIGIYGFFNCSKLTQLIIPKSVTSINSTAFEYCYALESITVAKGNLVYTSDESNAIINKSTKTLVAGCKNTVIPEYVTCIGANAFYGQYNLKTIRIPDSVGTIYEQAFYACTGLFSVYIPSSVTVIYYDIFNRCNTGLLVFCGASEKQSVWNINWNRQSSGNYYSVTYGITREEYEESIPFELTEDNYEMAGIERSEDVVIPEMFEYNGLKYKVMSIGENAFYNCSGLTSIQIPDSVTNIGSNAFYGCSGLKSIEIPASVLSIDTTSFIGTNFESMSVAEDNPVYDSRDDCNAIITTKSNTLLHGCANTVISDNVITIGTRAFQGCTGLMNIFIPNSVASIETYAFSGCSGLTNINIPEKITTIADYAFENCIGLTSINIPKGVTKIGNRAFLNCTGIVSLDIPNSVTTIGEYAFANFSIPTSLNIPESVTSIGIGAFQGWSGLVEVSIPKGVTKIMDSTFNGCTSLTSVDIPDSVQFIYNNAFQYCTSLTNVSIPESVTVIGWYAFAYCTSLTSVDIPDSATTIVAYAFRNCTNLKSIYIPSGVSSMASNVFLNCSSSLKIYCGASEPKEGWNDYWNYYATGKPLSVTYGVTREEYETLYKE